MGVCERERDTESDRKNVRACMTQTIRTPVKDTSVSRAKKNRLPSSRHKHAARSRALAQGSRDMGCTESPRGTSLGQTPDKTDPSARVVRVCLCLPSSSEISIHTLLHIRMHRAAGERGRFRNDSRETSRSRQSTHPPTPLASWRAGGRQP
ncbi:hypothetical protein P4O66_004426 [Electrophorus voltai]|uniref:Uncharacterized protein n=1 Tax=Electrophorus voltai TaxID=2609070 RepID=A0AAD8ZNK0_9TELE|nr:hypothetical protein P4O66_004426 [Electrophorus voltai]